MFQHYLATEYDINQLIHEIKQRPTNKEYSPNFNTLELDSYTEFEPVLVHLDEQVIRKLSANFSIETSNDAPYYESVYAQFKHLIHMYNEKWITSPRQLVLTSKDCLSTIHLVASENSLSLHCFQRSSNIDNALSEDIHFLCFLLMSVTKLRGYQVAPLWKEIKLFISIPHTFGNSKSKVEQ